MSECVRVGSEHAIHSPHSQASRLQAVAALPCRLALSCFPFGGRKTLKKTPWEGYITTVGRPRKLLAAEFRLKSPGGLLAAKPMLLTGHLPSYAWTVRCILGEFLTLGFSGERFVIHHHSSHPSQQHGRH